MITVFYEDIFMWSYAMGSQKWTLLNISWNIDTPMHIFPDLNLKDLMI